MAAKAIEVNEKTNLLRVQGEQRSRHVFVEPRPSWYDPYRTLIDFLAGLVLLLLAAPIIFLAAILVKLTSPGPAFYSQTRVGRDRRIYTIYKLRSMRHDCEKHSGPQWSKAGDARITGVGRFLRRTHIDELPQFWNVLRGEMSIVGPRPERPEFVPQLAEAVPLYNQRLLVKPGVTGLAQVQLPPDTDLESVRRKLAYDLYYIRHRAFRLGFKLFMSTALHVLGVPYSLLGEIVSLPSDKIIMDEYFDLVKLTRPAREPEPDSMVDSITVVNPEVAPCVS